MFAMLPGRLVRVQTFTGFLCSDLSFSLEDISFTGFTITICVAMNKQNKSWLFLSSLMVCFLLHINLVLGANMLSANQSLSGDQTLVSADQVFELGLFSSGQSKKYYIGIWYKQITPRTVVWVANREQPVSDKNSAQLRISDDGNLVLFNESKASIWSTNMSSTNSNLFQAILLDTGNLVLTSGSNTSQYLWQSFDYPTHTWLPGGKIRFDKRKNQSQLLTSWKNSEDPASGLFSLELDPKGSKAYFILWNKSEQYWTSGPWDGKIFSLVPEMRLNFLYNFTFIENDDESYFTFSMYNSSIWSRFVMDISGQIKMYSWVPSSQLWNLFWSQPRQQCDVYAYCGTFGSCDKSQTPCSCMQGFKPKYDSDWNLQDYSGGCERKTALQCGSTRVANADKDRFLPQPNVRLPDHKQADGAASAAECEASCLNNCTCTAYTYDSSGCSIWIGDILSLQRLQVDDSTGKTMYIRLAASEFPKPKSHMGMIAGIVVGVAVVILVLGVVLFIIIRQRKTTVGTGKMVEGSLIAFGYRDLQNATKNFSEKLGGGGFGSVFKGVLSDSTVVAVKRLEGISQGEKQFRTEVCTIGTIQHVNLVRLRGFCSEGSRKLLVYDYMPNGSLASHFFAENNNQILDWKTRYQIALGTARGLTYLHEKCRDCIIHCDIKPENILLDADYVPKVADFGLAKLVGRDFSRVLTTMRGTRGYLAPEWISGVAITAKADVYSYGMMLFEIVSGRRNFEPSEDGKVKFFPTWAASIILEGGAVLPLLDHRLEGNANAQELTRICKVACWCVQDDESHRPTMGQVVQILEGILDVNLPPVPKSLQVFVDNQDQIIFFTDSSTDQSSQTRSQTASASSQVKSNVSISSAASQVKSNISSTSFNS